MNKYIALTEEQKSELSKETDSLFSGFISFLLNGEEIASTDLLEMSMSGQRLRIAEMIGVKEFDDYWLLKEDKSIRAKASDIKGLLVTDIDTDYGAAQGIKYQAFLKRHDGKHCTNCGHSITEL